MRCSRVALSLLMAVLCGAVMAMGSADGRAGVTATLDSEPPYSMDSLGYGNQSQGATDRRDDYSADGNSTSPADECDANSFQGDGAPGAKVENAEPCCDQYNRANPSEIDEAGTNGDQPETTQSSAASPEYLPSWQEPSYQGETSQSDEVPSSPPQDYSYEHKCYPESNYPYEYEYTYPREKYGYPEGAGVETETEAVETTAPETETVETTAPETETVETTAPETETVETTAPETAPVETTAPETAPVETTAPETAPVETTAPETETVENAQRDEARDCEGSDEESPTIESSMSEPQTDSGQFGEGDEAQTTESRDEGSETTEGFDEPNFSYEYDYTYDDFRVDDLNFLPFVPEGVWSTAVYAPASQNDESDVSDESGDADLLDQSLSEDATDESSDEDTGDGAGDVTDTSNCDSQEPAGDASSAESTEVPSSGGEPPLYDTTLSEVLQSLATQVVTDATVAFRNMSHQISALDWQVLVTADRQDRSGDDAVSSREHAQF